MAHKLKDLDLHAFGDTVQMAGAIYSGNGRIFILTFPEDRDVIETLEGDPSRAEFLDMNDEDWVAFLRQTDLLEVRAVSGSPEKAILRKSARSVDNNVSWEVYRRDKFTCRYCAADKTPMTVDHLVLWEANGPWITANLVTACRKCNKTRGNTSYEDWLKNPYYLNVAKNLRPEVRAANEALLGTLDAIPRVKTQRSR